MKATEVIKRALKSTQDMTNMYLADLSDADLLVKPVPAANNIAWQLGHLIYSEVMLGGVLPGATYPDLPASLKEGYGGGAGKTSAQPNYLTKAEYLALFDTVRAATIANVERLSDADLDKPSPGDFAKWAPTLGDIAVLTANHTLMHAGQFTVVRRALGKPVLF